MRIEGPRETFVQQCGRGNHGSLSAGPATRGSPGFLDCIGSHDLPIPLGTSKKLPGKSLGDAGIAKKLPGTFSKNPRFVAQLPLGTKKLPDTLLRPQCLRVQLPAGMNVQPAGKTPKVARLPPKVSGFLLLFAHFEPEPARMNENPARFERSPA